MPQPTRLGATIPTAPARVVVAEPLTLLRHCLAGHLHGTEGLVVVGEAATGLEAVEVTRDARADLLVIDAAMPGLDAVEVTRRIRHELPATKVLVLTSDPQDRQVLEALREGVDGYLHKNLTPHRLIESIRAVLRGEKPISPVLMNRVVDGLQASAGPAPAAPPELSLSHRELEIMQLVAQGLSNKEIGRQLHITEGTVKNHVHHALHKLNMDNRIQAAAYLVRQGFGQRRGSLL